MKINVDDPIASSLLAFKDGVPLGLVRELDLETMEYMRLVPDGHLPSEPGDWVEERGKADFVVVGDLYKAQEAMKEL